MKLTTLITGLLAATACYAQPPRAEVLKIVTVTMTTYTQNPGSDNGTVAVTASPKVKVYNTQAMLNVLAQDKQAQGVWGSTNFPPGSKLAAAEDSWLVVDKANNVLADVSDILSVSGGNNEIVSGTRKSATEQPSPTVKSMQIVNIKFDDTAIPGGNNTSFYLQGLATSTVTDTTPTAAGVYTETHTFKLTGAAGEGTWGDGQPFVCTGNVTATGKAVVGQTNPPAGFAPASLAGYAATVKFGGVPGILISWGADTWAQTGVSGNTDADNYCAGAYTYVKTGPNTATLTSSDLGMMSWYGTSNFMSMNILFTSSTAALCLFTNDYGFATANVTLSRAANLVPPTLAGHTVQYVKSGSSTASILTFAADGTFTETKGGAPHGSGTYTFTQYSPTTAIIQQNYTDPASFVAFVEVTFTTATSGRAFFSRYDYENPGIGSNPVETGTGTFTAR